MLKPPISPVGLEYISEVLSHVGHHVIVVDLCFCDNWEETLCNTLSHVEHDYIGISIRNIDEAMMASQTFFVDSIKTIVHLCRQVSQSPILLGGIGFSIAPKEILDYTKADFGLVGNGVTTIADFITAIDNQRYQQFPGCIYRDETGKITGNPVNRNVTDDYYPSFLFQRNVVDIERYFNEGGQIGIETKRGCSQKCIYCVEENNPIILRNPDSVVYEIERLLNRGINVFHWCDSEFNIPLEHAIRVCDEIIRRGIHKEIKWYTYCSPMPFTEELAMKMEEAGCVGINFGVDALHNKILQLLGKSYRVEDVEQLVRTLRKTGIAIMFDLLMGCPCETRDTAQFTIENALQLKPDALGIALGVRLYPYTPLGRQILSLHKAGQNLKNSIYGKPLEENRNLLHPTYYLSEELDKDFFDYLRNWVKNEPSVFLSLPATEEGSYSYCNHDYLINAIKNGARGAYWDILRKRTLG